MIGHHRRGQLLLFALCGLAVVSTVGGWFVWSQMQLPATAGQIALLAQRCQIAMLKDVCGMTSGCMPKASQAGLFIAGVGEVMRKPLLGY